MFFVRVRERKFVEVNFAAKSFMGKFGEIRARILGTRKNLPAPAAMRNSICNKLMWDFQCHLWRVCIDNKESFQFHKIRPGKLQ